MRQFRFESDFFKPSKDEPGVNPHKGSGSIEPPPGGFSVEAYEQHLISSSSSSSSQRFKLQQQQQQKRKAAAAALGDSTQLKLKKAWETALAPAKSIPMNAFMMWMSGNSVQIFSILITVMLLFNSLKGAIGVQSVFERFQSPAASSSSSSSSKSEADLLISSTSRSTKTPPSYMEALVKDPLLVPKLTFILMQMANFALGMWKCGSMGLLPTAESDWLGFMQAKTSLERVF